MAFIFALGESILYECMHIDVCAVHHAVRAEYITASDKILICTCVLGNVYECMIRPDGDGV